MTAHELIDTTVRCSKENGGLVAIATLDDSPDIYLTRDMAVALDLAQKRQPHWFADWPSGEFMPRPEYANDSDPLPLGFMEAYL